ncbi:MAG: FKBP-type peptidyl-prolyl cis-trans isomerase [Chitinophagaceae bacterium]
MKKTNKYTFTGLFCIALSTISISMNAQKKDFKKLPSGLEYKMIVDNPSKPLATEGCMITMHIITSANDSVLFDSYKMNNNEPVPAQIAAPQFKGDLMEGLSLLSAGDSAIFKTPADSIFKNGGFPPFVKSGDFVFFNVKMVSVKTKEQHEAEAKAEASKQMKVDEIAILKYIKDNKLKALKTESGLYYVINEKGQGENAKANQKVSMNYTGYLLDGTIFDSNILEKFGHVQPLDFNLGVGQVIKGWDEGITLLNKGAKGKFIIPSTLAYGSRAMPGGPNNPKGIPANSILIFDVELLNAE